MATRAQKADLPAVHFHDLRHAGNTLTAHGGANLRELMARTGHSSTSAAMIYLHSTYERQREIAGAIGTLAAGELDRKPRRARAQHPTAERARHGHGEQTVPHVNQPKCL